MELLKNINDDYLSENHIKTITDKDIPNLFLLKYDRNKSNFKNEGIKQARGIILEKETNKIICYSLDKFENKDDLIELVRDKNFKFSKKNRQVDEITNLIFSKPNLMQRPLVFFKKYFICRPPEKVLEILNIDLGGGGSRI